MQDQSARMERDHCVSSLCLHLESTSSCTDSCWICHCFIPPHLVTQHFHFNHSFCYWNRNNCLWLCCPSSVYQPFRSVQVVSVTFPFLSIKSFLSFSQRSLSSPFNQVIPSLLSKKSLLKQGREGGEDLRWSCWRDCPWMVHRSIILESMAGDQGDETENVFCHVAGHSDPSCLDRELDQQPSLDLLHRLVCCHVSRTQTSRNHPRVRFKSCDVRC